MPKRDQVVERVRPRNELADVDSGEATRDAVEHDVQAVPARQHRVDERLTDVEATARGREHALDQLTHLLGRQDDRRQLMTPGASNEHPRRLVDPDLLDRLVVEVGLQRAEPGDVGDDVTDDQLGLVERSDGAGQAARLVLGDDVERGTAYGVGVRARVDATLAHEIAYALGERRCLRIHSLYLFPRRVLFARSCPITVGL